MYNPKKIINKVKSTILKLYSLQVVPIKRTLFILILSFLVIIFDALSIVSVVPLIQFIQYGLDVNNFIENTDYGAKIVSIFNFVNLSFTLVNFSLLLFFLILVRQCLSYIFVVEMLKTSLKIAKDLSIICFTKIMKARAEYIRTINTGQFSVIAERECSQVAAMYNYSLSFFAMGIQIGAYTFVMMFVSFYSTLVSILLILFIVFAMMRYVLKANVQGKIVVDIRKRFYNSLTEEFSMWRLIKFRSFTKDITQNILPLADKYAKHQLVITKYNERSRLLIILIAMLSVIALMIFSVEFLKIDYAKLTFFGLIFIRLIPLGQQINTCLAHIAQIEPSLEVVKNTIDNASANEENIFKGKEFLKVKDFINFKNINFNYPGSKYRALNNINIKIPEKKITAIVGKSGAGKSTLIDMLPRIIKPTSGNIYIDNVAIDNYSISSLRKGISYISQDNILFDGTIKENICYFNKNVKNEEFQEVLNLSGVSEFINNYEEKENFNLGEKGQRLSGGQKQRIILARALLTNASILILDEATSSLDIESERHIKKVLRNLIKFKGMTIIIISHRNEIIYDADYIIHLKDGTIFDSGRNKKVLNKYKN